MDPWGLTFRRLEYLAENPEFLRSFYEVAFGVGSLLSFEKASLPTEPKSAGLFHTAFLYPSRRDLAVALLRLDSLGVPVEGASDHDVSEAIYLSDPEGNGIEIYADRPKESWQFEDGEVTLGTYYLNLKDLVAQAPESAREAARENTRQLTGNHGPRLLSIFTPPVTREPDAVEELTRRAESLDPSLSTSKPPTIGHVHLRALDLYASETFWNERVGLQVMTRYAGVASFLAAGDYHHHIGVNRFGPWVPASPGAAGLTRMEMDFEEGGELAEGEHETPEGIVVSVRHM